MKLSRKPIEYPAHQADDVVMEIRESMLKRRVLQEKYNQHNLQAQENMGILSRETLLLSQAVCEGKRMGIVSEELERRFLRSWKEFEKEVGVSLLEYLDNQKNLDTKTEGVFFYLWKAIESLHKEEGTPADIIHNALSRHYMFSSPDLEKTTPTFHLFKMDMQRSPKEELELKKATMAIQDIYFFSLKLETVPHAKYLLCMKSGNEYTGGVALNEFGTESYPASFGDMPDNEEDLRSYLDKHEVSLDAAMEVGTFVLHPKVKNFSHKFIMEIARSARKVGKTTMLIAAHKAMVRHLRNNHINVNQIGTPVVVDDNLKRRLKSRNGWTEDLFNSFRDNYFRLKPIIASLSIAQMLSNEKKGGVTT